jgi:polyhydroxyalkanoate synthase subunit PhaC
MHAVTLKDTIHREGTAAIYRFRRPAAVRPAGRTPILLVPSLINRWYVLDLLEGSSVAGALSARFDTYCLDWGVPNDEDRYLTWDALIRRMRRAVRRVQRDSGAEKVALLGYCMGGTLTSIYAALHPESIALLINLAGPIDFSHGGLLRTMVEPRWFNASAIASAGNMTPLMMQSGFVALRPTLQLSKWVGFAGNASETEARKFFFALEGWANDNIAFPAAAYETYIRELYQENQLVRGEHWVEGKRADLARIRCPVLTIVAEKDTICPPAAATALNGAVLSPDVQTLSVPGGHVGAVVGARARDELYPRMIDWCGARIG